jgi:hypothetical protein
MTHLADQNKGPGFFRSGDQWIAEERAKANGDTQHQLAQDLAAINRLAGYANLRDGGNMPRPDRSGNAAAIIVLSAVAMAVGSIGYAIWEWWL